MGQGLETVTSVREMQEISSRWRGLGETIGFVPTMGYLHNGHLRLVSVAKEHATKVVASIFVNPTQFGPKEDFQRYPRDPEGDLKKLSEMGVEAVFMPTAQDMYPDGFQTSVSVRELTRGLCGASRPGHFDGVATVVCKLFNIVRPHFAVFGQKDYQQLCVIARMVKDLNMDVEIIGVPTVREPDGLAMSSRNSYLSKDERESATCLYKAILLAQELILRGERKVSNILGEVQKFILDHNYTRIDYVRIVDPDTLQQLEDIRDESLIALAVYVGSTRLIDNGILRSRCS